MKTVLLLRHAKSSWADADLSDFDRPLNGRGLEAAPGIGSLMFDKNLEADLILSSPAKRAMQTAILAKGTAQLKANIQYEEKIYEASPLTLLYLLAEQDDKNETISLVGHNPGLEKLTEILTGETIQMKTAMMAKIDLNIEKWSDILPNSGELDYVLHVPKDSPVSEND